MPKPPKIVPPPATPNVASYLSQGQSKQGMGQRPNKLMPITGGSSAMAARPSLLGGL